jgi:hypothetical protein
MLKNQKECNTKKLGKRKLFISNIQTRKNQNASKIVHKQQKLFFLPIVLAILENIVRLVFL